MQRAFLTFLFLVAAGAALLSVTIERVPPGAEGGKRVVPAPAAPGKAGGVPPAPVKDDRLLLPAPVAPEVGERGTASSCLTIPRERVAEARKRIAAAGEVFHRDFLPSLKASAIAVEPDDKNNARVVANGRALDLRAIYLRTGPQRFESLARFASCADDPKSPAVVDFSVTPPPTAAIEIRIAPDCRGDRASARYVDPSQAFLFLATGLAFCSTIPGSPAGDPVAFVFFPPGAPTGMYTLVAREEYDSCAACDAGAECSECRPEGCRWKRESVARNVPLPHPAARPFEVAALTAVKARAPKAELSVTLLFDGKEVARGVTDLPRNFCD